MKTRILTMALLSSAGLFGQVSIGIQIGTPPPRVVYVEPIAPGPDPIWVDGYWYADGRRWNWRQGYWARPPYANAQWMRPHYDGARYYEGYWVRSARGRGDHDRRWEGDYREHDRGHGHAYGRR